MPFDFGPRLPRSALRRAITAHRRTPEPECVPPLLPLAEATADEAPRIRELAQRLVHGLRNRPAGIARENLVQGLLQEFSLSSDEGVALMCLAEALLRIPDAATRDALIRDKVGRGDWRSHLGQSESPFVNAAAWGLLVTGKLVATHDESGLASALGRATSRFGEPVIRKAVDLGMRLLGKQFVAGETIEQALDHARPLEAQGFRYSYDMLGEAALTDADARRYYDSYERAIHAIGAASAGRGIIDGPGISIKLSALHPRYSFAQSARVFAELYPRLKALALLARRYDMGLNIDAEEADRLEISLDLLERLCHEPELAGWDGIGFVAQAYQKRCPFVVDFLIDLARRSGHRLMVRLVKGAYWDSEIKRAQVDGLEGYPVYTRKVYTDVAYLACARKLLAAPDAVYPQFATHNAQTLASVYSMAGAYQPGQYEFQCLHGMGEPLYAQVVGPESEGQLARPCRIYAPVGTHETLLAYLVRRLLENGANTSFINRIADPDFPVESLVGSPVDAAREIARTEGEMGAPHARIPLPRDLFVGVRANSKGLDLTDESLLARLGQALEGSEDGSWSAEPTLKIVAAPTALPVRNPADREDVVGYVVEAVDEETEAALRASAAAVDKWQSTPPAQRGEMLSRAADAMEAALFPLIGLLVREAGKTCANAVAEVREAVDFLRYYAHQSRDFSAESHRALGPVVCISPWNFPLAIFAGQVAGALAAGNPVIAKPAEQTPLVAAEAVRLLHAAGIPRDVLQLLPGRGETIGARLVADARVRGVVFTGSTDVARLINASLAGRLDDHGKPLALIAETGGQNAMFVDSSALAEQVVADILVSAFDSAGQRCSALRLLCIQEEIAEPVMAMLRGAMAELVMGDPRRLDVDVGPVIDEPARQALVEHIDAMRAKGRQVLQAHRATDAPLAGTFVAPTLVVIDDVSELSREVFGPVLHLVRYRRSELPRLVERINALGYGLTLGIHSRVDQAIDGIIAGARAGNVYVNRNIVGAVVGVQPFRGEGLSGTGPKAGGPMYLYRLLGAYPGGAAAQVAERLGQPGAAAPTPQLHALRGWAREEMQPLAALCEALATNLPRRDPVELPGPTGERNTYRLLPRRAVFCIAGDPPGLLALSAVAMAAGSGVAWRDTPATRELRGRLPPLAAAAISLVDADGIDAPQLEAILHRGSREERLALLQRAARRGGPIVSVHGVEAGDEAVALDRLFLERVVSVNTAAAGGNASLMTVG